MNVSGVSNPVLQFAGAGTGYLFNVNWLEFTPVSTGPPQLLAEGLPNKEIAQKANISAGAVRIHLGHIFKKLHVRCRTEAAAKYLHLRTK